MKKARNFFILLVMVMALMVAPGASYALNILLANDDGYGAPGIVAVQGALEAAGHNVYVVAPAENQSGKGTGINAEANSLAALTEMVPGKEWKMAGTPCDSVNVALSVALADTPIDLVISGANEGDNLGRMTNHSGTVSATMRAVRKGYPAIAISVAMDWYHLYSGYQLLGDEDPTNDQMGYQLIQQATANQLAAMDDAAALVVNIVAKLEESSTKWWACGRLLPEGIGLNVNIPAKETADWSGVLMTKSDDAVIMDLTFKDIGVPGQVLVTADIDDMLIGVVFGQVPVEMLDLESEGEANIGGYATISPMDGNWSSDGSFIKGRSVRKRLGDLIE